MHQSLRLLSGAALYALGYFSLAFCTGGWSLGTAVFVLTLGEVIVQPALFTQVSRLAPQGGVGRSMATLGLVRGIGMAVGPWIGSLVFQSYSGRSADSMGHSFLFRRHCRNRFSDNENGFPAADELISGRLQA